MATVVHDALELFRSTYACEPAACATAPGRVNLIGDHIDYCGGPVLPVAIDRRAAVCVGPRVDSDIHVVSRERPGERAVLTRADGDRLAGPRWALYAGGAAAVLGFSGGLNLAIASDVPLGSGLSSSAALEVAAVLALRAAMNVPMSHLDLARAAQRVEHDHVGVPCGIMDQYAAAFGEPGHALLIDCRVPSHVAVALDPSVAIVIVDSGVKHQLADNEYARRRQSCERARLKLERSIGPTPYLAAVTAEQCAEPRWSAYGWSHEEGRRARHVASEAARVHGFVQAMQQRDRAEMGRLMLASHASLRDDFEVSCPEVDALVEWLSARPGVVGARMTGGGFGGCVVALVETHRLSRMLDDVQAQFPGRLALSATAEAGAGIELPTRYDPLA